MNETLTSYIDLNKSIFFSDLIASNENIQAVKLKCFAAGYLGIYLSLTKVSACCGISRAFALFFGLGPG